MRRFLACAALLALALPWLASPARADDPAPDPLAKAREIERQGQALLDSGQCAEGARHMAEAWRIRAAVWGGGAGEGDRRAAERQAMERAVAEERQARERAGADRGADPRQKLEALHQALRAEEAAVEEARKAGAERAEAEHTEKAKALHREIKAVKAALEGAGAEDGDLAQRLAQVRAERRAAERAAETAAATGNEREAADQKTRAERLHALAEELAKAARARGDADAGAKEGGAREGGGREGGRGAAAVAGLAGDLARLRAEVADLRRLLEDLKERLPAGGK